MNYKKLLRYKQLRQQILFGILVFILFAWGYYPSPLCPYNPEDDFQIEPEYFSGILGASSILFGLWIITLEKNPIKNMISHIKSL